MKTKRSKSPSPDPSDDSCPPKRAKIESNCQDCKEEKPIEYNILDFSDDVLLRLMKYIGQKDLLTVSQCCKRFQQVANDWTLWNKIDLRGFKMTSMDQVMMYLKFFNDHTTKFAIAGDSKVVLSPEFFDELRNNGNQLKELIIEDFVINADKTMINHFPSTLEGLSLKGTYIQNLKYEKSYFFETQKHLPDLQSLILSHCKWITSHSFMALSKIPNLKELRLNSCSALDECMAYMSIATKIGFKKLEILDVRNTLLGDSEISCFNHTESLTHLYMEHPAVTDRPLRTIPNGSPTHVIHVLNPRIDRNVQYVVQNAVLSNFERRLITDRIVFSLLGDPANETSVRITANAGIAVIEHGTHHKSKIKLKALVMRNYSGITNSSLAHLATVAKSLEFLDLTGTGVTVEEVERFKSKRPEVTLASSFDEK